MTLRLSPQFAALLLSTLAEVLLAACGDGGGAGGPPDPDLHDGMNWEVPSADDAEGDPRDGAMPEDPVAEAPPEIAVPDEGSGDASGDSNEPVSCDADGAFLVTSTRDDGEGSLRDALRKALNVPGDRGPVRVLFLIPPSDPGREGPNGPWVIRLSSPLPAVTRPEVRIDAATQAACVEGRPAGVPRVALRPAQGVQVEEPLVLAAPDGFVRGLALGGFRYGILLYGTGASGNRLESLHIGVDPDGRTPRPNETGILLTGGASENRVDSCLVSGNAGPGIYLDRGSEGNRVQRCRVGTDAAGEVAVPNGVGIFLYKAARNLVGGPDGAGNLVSGNLDSGVLITNKGAEENRIEGNLIGTDASGTRMVGNDKGVVLKSLANRNVVGGAGGGRGNVISGNLEIGIYIEAAHGNRILGNYLGPDRTGTGFVRDGTLIQGNGIEFNTCAEDNVLGGLGPGEGNLISGNQVYGVVYYGNSRRNPSLGNRIGTDVHGTAALPNATGICFDCAAHDNEVTGNVLSGNLNYGMFFVTRGTEGNILRGNRIGTDAEGMAALPNDIGLVIATGASRNVVGGQAPEDANVISGNAQCGIMVTNRLTRGNRIQGNLLGTDRTGSQAVPNRYGVLLSTYAEDSELLDNVISGNREAGVILYEYAAGTVLAGNLLGTSSDGSAALGNGLGVLLDQRAHDNHVGLPGRGNVVAFSGGAGVLLQAAAGAGNSVLANEFRDNGGLPVDLYPYGPNANDPGDGDDGPNGGMNAPVLEEDPGPAGPGPRTIRGRLDTGDPAGALVEVYLGRSGPRGVPTWWSPAGITRPDASGNFRLDLEVSEGAVALAAAATGPDGSTSELSAYRSLTPRTALPVRPIPAGLPAAVGPRGHRVSPTWILAPALRDPVREPSQGGLRNPASAPDVLRVTTTRDFVPGSLREALQQTNARGGHVTIAFDIPTTDPGHDAQRGTWTIRYEDTPPSLTVGDVIIDGTTQAAARGDTNPDGPEIVLDGAGHSIEYGLSLVNAPRFTVRGLCITGFLYGIQVYGPGSRDGVIAGNVVGADARGMEANGNYVGIELLSGATGIRIGGPDPADGNLVSGNWHIGLRMSDAGGNVVQGNLVGVDRTGRKALPNYDGISVEGRSAGNLIGGSGPGEGNTASGNVAYGIDLFGAGVTGNRVEGNRIGTDPSGTLAVPNTYGILFDDRAWGNTVGGPAGAGNLISGNTAFGAYFYNNGTRDNVLRGNRIGTDAAGLRAIPNETGVHIDGATRGNVVDDNLVSGNLVAGITIFALGTDGNVLTRNRVGLDAAGGALGNGADGIRIAFGPKGNQIGGSPAEGNVIAFNGKNGVSVEGDGSTGNRISANRIHDNGHLGIDLFPEGVDPTDPGDLDEGPNRRQNAPTLSPVSCGGGLCTVSGFLDTPGPDRATVEVFAARRNGAGFLEGARYLGSARPDARGAWTMSTGGLSPGEPVTATATDANGNTSEFRQ